MTEPPNAIPRTLAEIRHAERREPVVALSELFVLDPAEIEEGYRDGFGGLACGDNRSRAYWHGWRNAMIDRGKIEKDWRAGLLAREALRFPGGVSEVVEHHRRVYPELKSLGLAE